MFAMSMSDNLFFGFLLFCCLVGFGLKKLKQIDSEGVVKKAAKDKFLGALTRWLK